METTVIFKTKYAEKVYTFQIDTFSSQFTIQSIFISLVLTSSLGQINETFNKIIHQHYQIQELSLSVA